MADIDCISVDEARRNVTSGRTLLVCAYEDEAKCNKIKLEGATSLASLQTRLSSLPKDPEIIFYCA